MACTSLQELETQEEDLSQRLKKLCRYYGDENESKLQETTEILFSMGLLYIKKAEVTTDMEQKLNFIKSAALMHAARVRFEKHLKYETKIQKVRTAIVKMEVILLKTCKGKRDDKQLIQVSADFSQKFEVLRKAVKIDLEELEVIDENVPEEEARIKREEKISLVEASLQKNSKNYAEIMREVAKVCLEILGDAPCQFAIAGLGSLARKEITLYSDFEHVIVLEEGVQSKDSYQKTREYFRWFSTLFHIIVIGIGETLIPSVGVKSLNDFYASDKSKNWFFDALTPAGVSFDGTMPHACKIPLGRQEGTERKPHIVELIQPVSLMVKYLTSEENLKNGYSLKDVFYDSCFIFGPKEIYDQFVRGSEEVMKLEPDSLDCLKKVVDNNACDAMRVGRFAGSLKDADFKSSLYRPLATLISYLCRLNVIKARSTFEKIRLLEKGDKEYTYLWAFAVACEIRMKLYAFGKSSGIRMDGQNISKFVGKPCLINCLGVISELCNYFWGFRYVTNPIFRNCEEMSKCAVYYFTKDFEALKKFFHISDDEIDSQAAAHNILSPGMLSGTLVQEYLREVPFIKDENKKSEMLKKIENMILSNSIMRSPIVRSVLANVYLFQDRDREALKVAESIFSDFDLSEFFCEHDTTLGWRRLQVLAAWKALNSAEMIKYCNRFLSHRDLDFPSRLMFQFGLARAHWHLNHKIAGELFRRLLLEMLTINKRRKEISKTWMLWIMHEVFRFQFIDCLYDDCYNTLKMAEDLIPSGNEKIEVAFIAPQFVSYLAVIIWFYAIDLKESIDVAEKFLICDKAVTVAMMQENNGVFHEFWSMPILGILESCADDFNEFDIWYFGRILSKTPSFNRFSCFLKARAISKFTNILNHVLDIKERKNVLRDLDGALTMISITHSLHPILVPHVHKLCTFSACFLEASFPFLSNTDSQCLPNNATETDFTKLYSSCFDTCHSLRYLNPVDNIFFWVKYPDKFSKGFSWLFVQFQLEIKRSWRSLFIMITTEKSKKENIFELMDLIYGHLCCTLTLELCHILRKYYDAEMSFPNSPLGEEFGEALKKYMKMDLTCALEFLSIIFHSDQQSIIHEKSNQFLHLAILNSLLQSPGYVLKQHGHWIAVSNTKSCKGHKIVCFRKLAHEVLSELDEEPFNLKLCGPIFL